tara:strand:+ start:241 stop:405 length:165 start_codon:yes stop_codon:yes gene_type:complete
MTLEVIWLPEWLLIISLAFSLGAEKSSSMAGLQIVNESAISSHISPNLKNLRLG